MKELSISIICSVYNEEDVIQDFWGELKKQLQNIDSTYEVIFVNDGSNDNSAQILDSISEQYESVKVIHFTRNFGHESAMLAGIDYSKSEAVICLDSDLQHPPDKIKDMIAVYQKGYDVVMMVRKKRKDAGFIKRITTKLFYYILNKISKIKVEPNASDFFLISKRVADILKENYRERVRFLRGLIQLMGFKKTTIEYIAPVRRAGKSKYSFIRLLVLSASAIASTSQAPLYFSVLMGVIFGLLSLVLTIFSIVMKFMGNPFSGYTTIIVFLGFAFSMLFFILGIIGQYIGNIFSEVKNRPIYIIDRTKKIQ